MKARLFAGVVGLHLIAAGCATFSSRNIASVAPGNGSKSFPLVREFEAEGWLVRALPRPESVVLKQGIGGRPGNAACFELRPGEKAANGKRAELTDYHYPPMESTVVYRFSTFIPQDYPSNDSNSTVIAQWHTPGPLKPPMAFRFREDRLDVTLNFIDNGAVDPAGSQQVKIARIENFAKGVWHDFVFKVKWSPGDGFVEGWVDGKKVVDYKGQTEYASEETGPYFKYGIYVSKELSAPVQLCQGPYEREQL